ncbi:MULTISPECIES: hypothetical protein [unclassified Listeria]|uniref:hypothetical protein n=1 Tax=unclassified Listeria TaxID=2642072 RepID=UPI000B5976AD|nr:MULTISPECIES: hypothetical protein [unclassified Listeria]
MTNYQIKQIFNTIVIFLGVFFLISILWGQNLKEFMGVDMYVTVIFIIIGATLGVLSRRKKMEEEQEQERRTQDERFIMLRNKIAYKFLYVLVLVIPMLIIVISYNGITEISIRWLALGILLIAGLYFAIIEWLRRK